MILGSVSMIKAQTYSLNDLSESDFAAGGGTYWSFEKYDIATGTYSVFSTYGDEGRTNYYDRYNPERFAYYPIMTNPEGNTDPYKPGRNSWYDNKDEYLYVSRDYAVGTACVDLFYGTTIPSSVMGYEVYSAPAAVGGTFRNSAITFLVPQTGFYKVDMSVLREDNITTANMNVIQRFRYGGKNTVSDASRIDHGFAYGAGDGKSYETTLPAPESPCQDPKAKPRFTAQEIVSNYFYIYAKEGDKISFEVDARDVPVSSNVRDVWARTKWTNLKLEVVSEEVAKADPDKFTDPYVGNEEVFTQLDGLLEQAEELINNHSSNKYPAYAKVALELAYTTISTAYDAGNIYPMEAIGFVEQMQTAVDNYLASAYGLKVNYIFNDVAENTVPDASGSGHDATLYNNAEVLPMGKYNVLSLGNGTGYLDMGKPVGSVVANMNDFTISAYYRVDESASLSGAGHFLWAFSSQTANSAGAGEYAFYQLNSQTYSISPAGWNNAKNMGMSEAATKSAWQHVVLRQTGTTTELFINGEKVNTVTDSLPLPASNFTASTSYNWIARPPFNGDNYLKNTLIYDFRLYNEARADAEIAEWATLLTDLDYEYNYGTKGDFTGLTDLINECKASIATAIIGEAIGQFPEMSKIELEDAIQVAQTFVNEDKGSQFLIDAQIASLNTAYNKFLASVNYALAYPSSEGEGPHLESGLYYIKVGDYYLTMPETGANNTHLELRPFIPNPGKINNNQVWNVQYNKTYSDLTAEKPAAIFSIVSDKGEWETDGGWHMDEVGRMKEGNTEAAQSATNSNWTWREHMIFFNGTAYSVVNHYKYFKSENSAIVFPNETENEKPSSWADKKFQYKFVTKEEAIQTSIYENVTDQLKFYGGWGEVIVFDAKAGDNITVYDISGRQVKALKANGEYDRIDIRSGIYIIKVGEKVAKVIVR